MAQIFAYFVFFMAGVFVGMAVTYLIAQFRCV